MSDIQTEFICPECGYDLWLDKGTRGSFKDSEIPPVLYCEACEWEEDVIETDFDVSDYF